MLAVIQSLAAAIGLLLEITSLGPIGAGIAVFTGLGAGLAMGYATGKAMEAIGRQPEASGKIRTVLLLGLAFIETTALYGLVVAFMLIGQ